MPSLSYAVPTFRRPDQVARTVLSIHEKAQHAPGWVADEIVVVDNDPERSAESTIADLAAQGIPVRYCNETTRGVVATRNRLIDEITSDFVLFIDDDEYVAGDRWPVGLQEVQEDTDATFVGGPVERAFDEEPPSWIKVTKLFHNDNPPTGTAVDWLRSGNLLMKKSLVEEDSFNPPFDPDYGTSGTEDAELTRRAKDAGHLLSWSHDSVVIEQVPAMRITLKWTLQRFLMTNSNLVRMDFKQVHGGNPSLKTKLTFVKDGLIRIAGGALMAPLYLFPPTRDKGVNGICYIGKGVGYIYGVLGFKTKNYG